MKNVNRTIYISKENLTMIMQNFTAKDVYNIFSTSSMGTVPIDISFSVPEEFRLTEDVLQEILEGLFPALEEDAIEAKAELVKNHLRTIGATL
jgi:hypothetical protein